MKIYLVGGAVRAHLLKEDPKDKDYVVVGATPEMMLEKGFKQVGASFPVFLHPSSKEEYALARRELKTGAGYHGFKVDFSPTVTLEEDLQRRDLTINSMAMDMETGEIIDPYGGAADLRSGLLRATSDAFQEDPLRVLRIARFAAHYRFAVERETKELVKRIKEAGELKALKGERVRKELEKAFLVERPSLFFETLSDLEVLGDVFPDLARLVGVPQNPRYHPEGDAFVHTMLVLDHAARRARLDHGGMDFGLLISALCHDFGKGLTPKEILPGHGGHEAAGVPLVKEFSQWIRLTREEEKLALAFTEYHLLMHRSRELKPSRVVKLLVESRLVKGGDFFEKMLTLAKSDNDGKSREGHPYPEEDLLRAAQAAISSIDMKSLVESIPKKQIEQRVHEARVTAVKKALRAMAGGEESGEGSGEDERGEQSGA